MPKKMPEPIYILISEFDFINTTACIKLKNWDNDFTLSYDGIEYAELTIKDINDLVIANK